MIYKNLAGKYPVLKILFFHTFQPFCISPGKQLILTCDKAPAELEGMEDRLLSRFRWGLSAEIKAPDFDTRKEIVLNKARKDGIDFSEEVIEYIFLPIRPEPYHKSGSTVSRTDANG